MTDPARLQSPRCTLRGFKRKLAAPPGIRSLAWDTYCVLWGKSSKCVMVTKGWFRVSMGVILLSASMVSIFFNRSMNSRRSAFSTNMSLPSKSVVMFTCSKWGQVTKTSPGLSPPDPPYSAPGSSIRPLRHPVPFPDGCVALREALPGVSTAQGMRLLSPQERTRDATRRGGRGPRRHLRVHRSDGSPLLLLLTVRLEGTSHHASLKRAARARDLETDCLTMRTH